MIHLHHVTHMIRFLDKAIAYFNLCNVLVCYLVRNTNAKVSAAVRRLIRHFILGFILLFLVLIIFRKFCHNDIFSAVFQINIKSDFYIQTSLTNRTTRLDANPTIEELLTKCNDSGMPHSVNLSTCTHNHTPLC